MRALLPEPDDAVDVLEHYAAGWADHGGIRANMIAAVDGAVSAQGLSAGLQTAGDNRVFAALRELADVVLVGWATAAAEGYRPVQVAAEEAARRARFGLASVLPVAVVTRSLAVDLGAPLFADPQRKPLVVTCASADPARRAALDGRADILVCGEDSIDLGAARAALAERGLSRVLCEGGPRLLGQVLASGELDELCLSLSPLAVGPGPGRIVAGDPWDTTPRQLRLAGLLEEDGALFLRYMRPLHERHMSAT